MRREPYPDGPANKDRILPAERPGQAAENQLAPQPGELETDEVNIHPLLFQRITMRPTRSNSLRWNIQNK